MASEAIVLNCNLYKFTKPTQSTKQTKQTKQIIPPDQMYRELIKAGHTVEFYEIKIADMLESIYADAAEDTKIALTNTHSTIFTASKTMGVESPAIQSIETQLHNIQIMNNKVDCARKHLQQCKKYTNHEALYIKTHKLPKTINRSALEENKARIALKHCISNRNYYEGMYFALILGKIVDAVDV